MRRISRLGQFGRLATGMAGGMLAEGARRLTVGERRRMSDMLTDVRRGAGADFGTASGLSRAMPKMVRKGDLPTKICAACGLPVAWRKKWARDWGQVKYCSDLCRSAPSDKI